MVTSTVKVIPSEKVCTEHFNEGKKCLGEQCSAFSFVDYGGFGHLRVEGGCWRYHLPKVIRKIDW